MTQKSELRDYYRLVRQQISPERRESAAQALLKYLSRKPSTQILSFVSFGTEIDLILINHFYASEKRLNLPKLHLNQIEVYQVEDLQRDLLTYSAGPSEPNPERCQKMDLARIDLVLVPGLTFDANGYRLGYGKGHYDRLLARIPQVHTIGVGFVEQKSETPLPKDPWDAPVSELLFV